MDNSHPVCNLCGGKGCEKCHSGWECTGETCNKCAMDWKLGLVKSTISQKNPGTTLKTVNNFEKSIRELNYDK
jgi:hypothetical protein